MLLLTTVYYMTNSFSFLNLFAEIDCILFTFANLKAFSVSAPIDTGRRDVKNGNILWLKKKHVIVS